MNARRQGGALLACLALSLIAGACAPKRRVTEIVFWHFRPAAAMAPLVKSFERENPGLAVRMEPLSSAGGRERIYAAVDSGIVPDLCEVGATDMPRLLAANALIDWSAGIADLKPGIRGWEMCSIGEANYGMPWLLSARALFYNKTLFARARLDSTRPPETWDDLGHAAFAIQRLGHGVRGFGMATDPGERFASFMPFAWGNGGELFSSGLDSSRLDSPENREALAFCLGLRRATKLAPREALDREFASERLGLEVADAALLERLPREAPNLRFGVALAPSPAADQGTHASLVDGRMLVGFLAAKHKEGALRLARFLVRPDNAVAIATAGGSFEPATVAADSAALDRARPARRVLIRQLETARGAPNLSQWQAMEAAIEDALATAFADASSPAESSAARALAAADSAVAELLKRR